MFLHVSTTHSSLSLLWLYFLPKNERLYTISSISGFLRSCSIGSLVWKLPTSVDDLQLSKGRFDTFDVTQLDGSNVTDRPPFTFLIYVVCPAECFPKPVTNNGNRQIAVKNDNIRILYIHILISQAEISSNFNMTDTSEWHIKKIFQSLQATAPLNPGVPRPIPFTSLHSILYNIWCQNPIHISGSWAFWNTSRQTCGIFCFKPEPQWRLCGFWCLTLVLSLLRDWRFHSNRHKQLHPSFQQKHLTLRILSANHATEF